MFDHYRKVRINDPIIAVTDRARLRGLMTHQAFKLLKLVGGGFAAVLLFSPRLFAQLPDTNLCPNGSFEEGTDLDSSTPLLDGWSASGSNAAIDILVSDASSDGTYALAVLDEDPSGYGEWFSELPLAGIVNDGDTLEISWDEMFRVDAGEMRLSILFFNGEGAVASQKHFVTSGESAGWTGDRTSSPFVPRLESVPVPQGAVRMSISLVSGGPSETTGIMIIDSLRVLRPNQPVILPGNFRPNATFEAGADLDNPSGEVDNWNRGGNDPSINQITSEVSISPSHALIVRDENAAGFGEWYSDLDLAGLAAAGDTLNLQWFEIFNITGGEMRLTSLFFDASDQVLGERHFTATGDSQGWQTSLANSTFSRRIETLTVPGDAVKWRLSLVSGGSEATTGIFVIDDLSAALAAAPQVLANNFWENPGFEEGAALDETDGTLTGWNRGGSDVGIDRISNEASVSPSHALAVIDESTTDFGEWYGDKALEGFAEGGDVLNVQWFELFNVSENGAMRLSILFFGSDATLLGEYHYETSGQSAGWAGELATSTFSLKNAQIIVPALASKMRISLVSGGPLETTGVMAIDDLSVARISQENISPGNFWPNPTFELGSQLDDPATANPAGWNRGGSNATINAVTNENSVSPSHALAVIDDDDSGYGEWYQSVPLAEGISAGDELLVKWFEMYGTDGEMRLSCHFFDSADAIVGEQQFVISGESEDWMGDIASSQFTPRQESLFVPEGATRLQIGLVSGGSEAVTGIYVIDDLSISPPPVEPIEGPLEVTAFSYDPTANILTITWSSSSTKTYSIESSPDLVTWDETVKSNIAATETETSHSFQHPGLAKTFFRVMEE